jgi:hypothetical protein
MGMWFSSAIRVIAWQIPLQKSFCIDQHKLSGLYARRSNNHLRDYIICDELTGDFGYVLVATSVGDCGSFGQLREIDRMPFWEFCNSIGTKSTFRRRDEESAFGGTGWIGFGRP